MSKGRIIINRKQHWAERIQPMIERGQVVPVVPDQQICVFAFEGNASRFAAIFNDVWAALPSDDRDIIYSHWCQGFMEIFSPRIELSGFWGQRKEGELGAALELGHRLVFVAPSVDQLSDAAVTELIAHDLAHVFQEATMPGVFLEKNCDDWIESDADDIVDQWGFELYVIGKELDRDGRSVTNRPLNEDTIKSPPLQTTCVQMPE